jgi:hypothetical protein
MRSSSTSVRKAAVLHPRPLAVAALSILFTLGGCTEKAPATPVAVAAPSQSGWRRSEEPVIRAGDMRKQALWNDPSVLEDNGQFVLYFTTSVDKPFEPPILPFRAVSADGKSWRLDPDTPLVQATGTDFVAIETPSVIKFGGRYHMYFTGIYKRPDPAPMAIGHAVSDDGIHWTVDPHPVLAATGAASDWNGYLVGEPGAVVFDNQILLYFCATGARKGGKPPQLQTIGLARSTDGKTFGPPEMVLQQSELYPASEGYAGYSTPAAFVAGGKVHLVYDVAHFQSGGDPEWEQVALHHAVSSDGGKSFVQDKQPIFTRSDFNWTSGEILGPTVLVHGDEVMLWFGGHVRRADLGPMIRRGIAGPEFGIGFATKPLSDFTGQPAQASASTAQGN